MDAVGGEPAVRSLPEPRRGDSLFVVEDLGVGDAGAVIDSGVDVSIANVAVPAMSVVAASVDPLAASVGDPGQLLDVDVHQLTGTIALIATRRLSGGSVTTVETGESLGAQHRLHRRCRKAELVADVISAPTMPAAELNDPSPIRVGGAGR